MFAGIAEGTGTVAAAAARASGKSLMIDLGHLAADVRRGDSVAVDGVCLTAAAVDGSRVSFDVMRETLKKTTLGKLAAGHRVNIERSLKVGARNAGHMVQGHVQEVGKIVERIANNKEYVLWVAPGESLMKYVAPQGSVAVQGVSLTVADVRKDRFAVALVPTTLERTNLGDLREGGEVNIETDIIARQVVRYLELTHV